MSSSTLDENELQFEDINTVNCYENHDGMFGPSNVPEYPVEITDKTWDTEILNMDSLSKIMGLVTNFMSN